jgi:hypothetical protein
VFRIIDDGLQMTAGEAESLYPDYYILFEIIKKNEKFSEILGKVVTVSDGLRENEEYAMEKGIVFRTTELTGNNLRIGRVWTVR